MNAHDYTIESALGHMTEARDIARAEVERLTEAVRALHQPAGRHNFCGTCAYAPWPCATIRALDAAPRGGE